MNTFRIYGSVQRIPSPDTSSRCCPSLPNPESVVAFELIIRKKGINARVLPWKGTYSRYLVLNP